MASQGHRLNRRGALAAFGVTATFCVRSFAFGQDGAFHPRLLRIGSAAADAERASGAARWSWELIRRTSAPARLSVESVRADAVKILEEPFTVWMGSAPVAPLSEPELRGLRRYLTLGGVLFVDDSRPETGEFGRSARAELARVLPDNPVVKLSPGHVLYKSYYLLDRPVGRVEGAPFIEAITSGSMARVLFSSHDLLGALATDPGGGALFAMTPGSQRQREFAVRFAVNLAMYVLCLDYKDDQVHAEELMRRRGRQHR